VCTTVLLRGTFSAIVQRDFPRSLMKIPCTRAQGSVADLENVSLGMGGSLGRTSDSNLAWVM
jgi:hypothetical protein